MADEKTEGMYSTNRDITISTTKGFTFVFKKDESQYVPPSCRREMFQYGVLPVDGSTTDAIDPNSEKTKEPEQEPVGEERIELIKKGINSIIARNNPDDFTAANLPRGNILAKEIGFKVDAAERQDVFAEIQRENNA